METVRVAQINILNWSEGLEYRYKKLAEHLVNEDIEIVAVQELALPSLLTTELEKIGFIHNVIEPYSKIESEDGSVAIYSKHPIIKTLPVDTPEIPGGIIAQMNIQDRFKVNVVSAHFKWGSESEHARWSGAMKLTKKIIELEKTSDMTILCTDLNAGDESLTYKYLTGKWVAPDNSSTHWTDAYETIGKPDQWATSYPLESKWGSETCRRRGINVPSYVPARRIDYIMTFGWNYGKPGHPLIFKRFGEATTITEWELSDHYGLIAEIVLTFGR